MLRVVGLTFLFGGLGVLLLGCANNGGSTNLFGSGTQKQPVKLFGQSEAKTDAWSTGEVRSAKVAINEADLKKAIHRYRISVSIKSGTSKTIGVDLNSDGQGEALVYFEGDEWCVSTGCRLVVFAKGVNGFRPMSQIKRVKLPVMVGSHSSEGWRDLFVRSGNKSIGERWVPLKFKGNYPSNATTVGEKIAELPAGSELLIEPQSTVVQAQ